MDSLSEMLKGVLEGMILEIISQQPTYGYAIVRALSALGLEEIVEGTVYTVLLRLERGGLVETFRQASELGPPRKFYRLNDAGQRARQVFWRRWARLSACIDTLKKMEGTP